MLKGTKVTLRPVKLSDTATLAGWMNDQDVVKYLSRYLPITEMEEEEWIKSLAKKPGNNIVLIIEAEKKMIGSVGLHNINWKNGDGTFGIVIGNKNYWSKGFGTEAASLIIAYGFNQLNLHRISSMVYDFNERSLKLYLKLGFQEEGYRREAMFKDGLYCDIIELGLLRAEWRKK